MYFTKLLSIQKKIALLDVIQQILPQKQLIYQAFLVASIWSWKVASKLEALKSTLLLVPRKNSAEYIGKNIWFLLIEPKKISAWLLFSNYELDPKGWGPKRSQMLWSMIEGVLNGRNGIFLPMYYALF